MRIFRRDGRIHVRTSTQTPFPTKEKLGYLFSRDPDHFHVYTKRVGGGFGGKQEMLGRRALAEIRAPIGINIGVDSPAEIAVSVLAECSWYCVAQMVAAATHPGGRCRCDNRPGYAGGLLALGSNRYESNMHLQVSGAYSDFFTNVVPPPD